MLCMQTGKLNGASFKKSLKLGFKLQLYNDFAASRLIWILPHRLCNYFIKILYNFICIGIYVRIPDSILFRSFYVARQVIEKEKKIDFLKFL